MLDPRTLGPRKLAALGALGACGGMLLLLLLLLIVLRPFPRGGMDGENYWLTLMSFAGILAALIAVHLAFARQLWYATVTAAEEEARRARAKRKARS
jgi:hypothetical protein